ncbi:protease SohB [Pseudidiomarina mangrovi]|uniref:protease SohB n=1 Tax=Pseudidiomarina mangrovi TaxID=2487133 RepID=UPI000FCBB612|nr:protease SohB [Pseudidiomarina mangrovi]
MELLWNLLEFVAKAAIIVFAIMLVVGTIANAAQRQKSEKGELQLDNLSASLRQTVARLKLKMLDKKAAKKAAKVEKQQAKRQHQQQAELPRLFVLDFVGGMEAKEVDALSREVTAIIATAQADDQVLVRLESGGGTVNGYGLGAAQLQRLRDAKLQLTVCVDRVAASGGYMMACVAHQLVAAPFAIVGSIGVVAQMPNFNRFLKKHKVDFEQITAGEYKRTLTLFGENTDAGRHKFKQDLESIHQQFKAHISQYRPQLELERVATGEFWTAQQAIELGLLDKLQTSDAWLLEQAESYQIFALRYVNKKPLGERIGRHVSAVLTSLREFVQK